MKKQSLSMLLLVISKPSAQYLCFGRQPGFEFGKDRGSEDIWGQLDVRYAFGS